MTVRVLAPPDSRLEAGTELELDREESRYVSRVRRQVALAKVEVLGHDSAWEATLIDPGSARHAARVRLDAQCVPPRRERAVHLVVAVVERSACLELVRNACALDVASIVLTRCARSQHSAPKPGRIEGAIDAARRQCGRADRPRVVRAPDLESGLELAGQAPLYFASPGAARVHSTEPAARVAVGPEGGFDEAELRALRAAQGRPMGLGPWILRTELAVVLALGALAGNPAPAT